MLQKPTLSPQPQHHNGWKSRASSGRCRDMSKTILCSHPLRLLSPGTLSPTVKETLQAPLYGDQEESGDNRGLQQKSSPWPRCGSPRHCLAIKSWRDTAMAPGATAPMARGAQEQGPPGSQPHSEGCNGSGDVARPWDACQENMGRKASLVGGSLPQLSPAPGAAQAPHAAPLPQGPALP